MKTTFTISQVITTFREKMEEKVHLTVHQQKVLGALEECRTAALGGHVDACPACGYTQISYNSCRNRHCPICQGHAREKWVEARKKDVLPVKYYHVVFTLPDKLNSLILAQKKELYALLFKAASKTVDKFFRKQGLQGGMIALLHTWGSNLHFHPHLHCIVPGGGIDKNGHWKALPGSERDTPYLFPVKAMSKVFRAKFMSVFPKQLEMPSRIRKMLFDKEWVVYCKRPMKIGTVIDYLGRYSHRIAISNRRITDVNDHTVSFTYKEYKQNGINKEMTLSGEEFLRRFCQHILPRGFVRIRHYGFLASSNKAKLEEAKLQTKEEDCSVEENDTETGGEKKVIHPNSFICPHCKLAYMSCIEIVPAVARSPPFYKVCL